MAQKLFNFGLVKTNSNTFESHFIKKKKKKLPRLKNQNPDIKVER